MKIIVDRKPLKFGLCLGAAVMLLGFALWHTDGPMSQCEDAGGQMLVGLDGETSCIDGKSFVPMETYGQSGKSN